MKIISTCLVLAVSGFAFSQFSRTYLHATPSQSTFSSYAFATNQNQQYLVSLGNRTTNQLQVVTQEINNSGDVTGFNVQNYAATLPSNMANQYLMGVAENQNERFYVVKVGSNGAQNIIWLKVNKTTGALISSLASTETYRVGFFEAKLIGNELVFYDVKSTGGLVRVALNTTTFASPTEEVVDASIVSSSGFANALNGYKSGNLMVVNNLEKVVLGSGVSQAKVFTRTGANNYTAVTTGISATNRSVSSFLVDPTTIGVTNGIAVEHYNASGTMVASGTFSGGSVLPISQVTFTDNAYHIFTKPMGTGTPGTFYKANTSFSINDSVKGIVPIVYHLLAIGGSNYMVGSGMQEKGISEDLSGQASVGASVYFEKYLAKPVLNYSEYGHTFKAGSKTTARIGLGSKVIAVTPLGLPGLTYDNRSACYSLAERYVGFTSTDTISNDRSTYQNEFDELPGPYTTNAQYNEILEAKYNRPYHVSRKMIEDHIDSLQIGSPAYIPAFGILNWPAHGNTALGQAADLAEFIDVNANGVYEPLLGDYPEIYGNNCVLSITHYRDNGDASKAFEIQSYVYTQSCDTSEVFDNVLMRKVKVISRGAEMDSLFFGGHFDGDLGNYNDDYIGTHVELGMLYNYNADLNDEASAGRLGFNDTLAAQGIMVLKGFKQANDGLDNEIGIMPGESVNGYGYGDGTTDNEHAGLYTSAMFTGTNAPSGQTDPTSPIQLLNYLNGFWQFGDQILYGGTGYPSAPCVTTIESNYMYPGDSDPLHFGTEGVDPGFGWSEYEPCGPGSTSNMPGDRRGMYSFGKTALGNGEMFELDYAYLIKRRSAPGTTILDPVNDLFVKATAVRNAFMDNEGPCGINFDPIEENLSVDENVVEDVFSVYPNPTTGNIRIKGISENGGTIRVFDINGKLLQTVSDYQTMQELDLSRLEGNLFILQITDGSKSSQKRVVKY